MKLTARDSAGFLKSPAAQSSAVLLYGPDSGLVRERSKAIATTVIGPNSDPMNLIELAADHIKSDPALLRDELCALSLMGGKRLVVLRDAGDKLTHTIKAALEGLDTTTYLIVEGDELASTSSLRKLFEATAKLAALPCYRDEGRGLQEIIQQGLAKHGLRASSDAMHYLVSHLGNDRGITLGEIEKIALYMGGQKEVTLEIAQQLIGHNGAESMDDICHAVACGNLPEAQSVLARLLFEGTQPVAIVRSLLRHFQRLDIASAHMAGGKSVEGAVEALRPPVFFKYIAATKRALSLHSPRGLALVEALLLKTEKDLKSGIVLPSIVVGHSIAQIAARNTTQKN